MKTDKKPRGRPKADKTANARFEIRCSTDEKERWSNAAKKENKTLAAWLKDLANKAA